MNPIETVSPRKHTTGRFLPGIFTVVACLSACLLFFSSCEDSQDNGPDDRYDFIKVFDIEIGEILNSDYRIAASNERYFMAFQVELFNTYRTVLLVTDKTGAEINRDTLPSGIVISNLLVQDDGSVLLAGFMYCCPNINIFHYDQDATLLAYKTLYIPGINFLSFYTNPQFDRSLNGNILVYGNYIASGNLVYGYMAEVDLQGNIYWVENMELLIRSATPTSDNGYLFASYMPDTTGGIDIYLVKTNATGDSVGSNMIKQHALSSNISNIVSTSSNTYQVNYTEEYPSYVSTIYESDVNGNELNTLTLENTRLGWLTPRDDGRTLVLFSPYAYASGNGVTTRGSTRFMTLDRELKVSDKYYFQDSTSDLILSTCRTPEGKIACFGVIQSFKNAYYRPTLVVLN